MDPLPQTRLNFYQIRQQDYNGAVKISSVLQVGYNYSDVKVVNQNHELQIQFGISARDHAPLHIRIMSLSGALIYEEKILDPVTVEVIPFDPQTKGIYFLSVTGDHFRYFTRLLSQEN